MSSRLALRSRLLAAAVLPLTALGLPLWLRFAALHHKQVHPTAGDLRGAISDLAAGLVVLGLAWLLARWTRVGALLLALCWAVLNFINAGHVKVLDSCCTFRYAHYLTDPAFLQGSLAHPSHPFLAFGSMALLAATAAFWPAARPFSPRLAGALAATALACVLAVLLWPIRPEVLDWRQSDFVAMNLAELLASPQAESLAPVPKTSAEIPNPLLADLSGKPLVPLAQQKPNVLLVLLESVSGAYVPSIAAAHHVTSSVTMPRLSALAAGGITYTSVFAHQRQTNRGEYAVICGDYPKLRTAEARMSEYAARGGARPCLPRILSQAGYATAYLQSAPTAFMQKDRFMPKAGFDETLGVAFFPGARAVNGWGVDDLSFFEGASRLVDQLQDGGSPWFLMLMTAGTHHPFLVPPECKGAGTPFAQSVACADLALTGFIENLRKQGVLDHTLVLISADESQGLQEGDDLGQELTQNWIPLIALLPGGAGRGQVVRAPQMQSDFALSVLDYLGLADKAPHFVGRSLFRSYAKPRPLYFANTYLRHDWMLGTDGILTRCTESLQDCLSYRPSPVDEPFSPMRTRVPGTPSGLAAWNQAIGYSVRPLGLEPKMLHAREPAVASHMPRAKAFEAIEPAFTKPVRYRLEPNGQFLVGGCLKPLAAGGATGTLCGRGALVYGPYAWAPQGATVEARFEVRVGALGPAHLRLQLTENRGNHELSTTQEMALSSSRTTTLETRFVASRAMGGIEARLLSNGKLPVNLDVVSAEVVVTPAAPRVDLASAPAAH